MYRCASYINASYGCVFDSNADPLAPSLGNAPTFFLKRIGEFLRRDFTSFELAEGALQMHKGEITPFMVKRLDESNGPR